jgi:hypothetical protein
MGIAMLKAFLGAVAGYVLGLVGTTVFLLIVSRRYSEAFTPEVYIILGVLVGGPLAVVGAIIGATSDIIDTIRKHPRPPPRPGGENSV